MPIDGLFIAIGYRPNTEAFRDWLEVDADGLPRRPRRDRLEDRRRVHRRRRPRPSLSPGGDRGRVMAARPPSTPNAGSRRRASPRPRPPPPGRGGRSRALRAPAQAGHRARRSAASCTRRSTGRRGRRARSPGDGRRARRRLRPGVGAAPFRPRIARLVGADIHAAGRAAPPPRRVRHRGPVRPGEAFPAARSTSCCRASRSSTSPIRRRRWPTSGAGCGRAARWSPRPSIAGTRSWRPTSGLPAGPRRALQRLVKATAADAHPLRRRLQRAGELRRALAAAGFVDVRLTTVGHLARAWGRHWPTFALGLAGDLLTSAGALAPLDDRRGRRAPLAGSALEFTSV